MKRLLPPPLAALALFAGLMFSGARPEAAAQDVKEQPLQAPHGVTIKVRMEGPYTADTPLQVVCYFKYSPTGAKRMSGAPVELDKRLGGVIASLRERGEFVGDQLETLLITPPKDSINAKALLLVGLGDENALSLELMEAVGRVSLREAARLLRQPGRLRAAHPRPGKLQVRHGGRGNGGRAGDAAGLRHGDAAPEGGVEQGLHLRPVDRRGGADVLR